MHYTTSCKHSLVLLRLDEIIARNMLSGLKLLINCYFAPSWLFILLYQRCTVTQTSKLTKLVFTLHNFPYAPNRETSFYQCAASVQYMIKTQIMEAMSFCLASQCFRLNFFPAYPYSFKSKSNIRLKLSPLL